ncbi:hypothetical protein AB0I72_00760 [Nocardiopsis sp. NPDC049922]|uniref:hypothetical protein n=1 Tax=Nocardiopsis sp. NPDC049922 TaxID=3155157 RepID=UPI0033C9B66C
MAGLGEAAQKHMEDLMAVDTWEWQSDFARKYVGIGREEGREEGRAKEAARNVILILQDRGLTPSEQERQRIESCTDLDTLKTWVLRAVRVERSEDLFD